MIPLLDSKQATERPLPDRLRESLAHVRMTLGLVWKSSATMTIALAAMTLIGGLVPLGVAYAGKRIVDSVVARSSSHESK